MYPSLIPVFATSHDTGLFRGFFNLPIHPAFVHFPLALLTIGWVLIYFRHWGKRADLEPFIVASLGIGVAALPFTIISGIRDANWTELFTEWTWDDPLSWHFLAAITAAGIFTGHFFYRRKAVASGSLSARVDLGLTSLGFWLLLMVGLIGAELVHA